MSAWRFQSGGRFNQLPGVAALVIRVEYKKLIFPELSIKGLGKNSGIPKRRLGRRIFWCHQECHGPSANSVVDVTRNAIVIGVVIANVIVIANALDFALAVAIFFTNPITLQL